MSDIMLDRNTHDLLIENNEIRLTKGTETIDQKIKVKLLFFFNEWFLDTRQGVPYYEKVFVKNPNIPEIEVIIKNTILTTNGVIEMLSFDSVFDKPNRIYQVFSKIRTTQGITTISQEFPLQ